MEVNNLVQELLEGSIDVKTSVDILAASLIEANNYPSRVPRRAGVRVSLGKGALDKTIPGMLWKGLVAPAGKGATDGLKSLAKGSGEAVGSIAKEALGGVGVDTSKISVSSSRLPSQAPAPLARVQDKPSSGPRPLTPSSPGGKPIDHLAHRVTTNVRDQNRRLPGNRSYTSYTAADKKRPEDERAEDERRKKKKPPANNKKPVSKSKQGSKPTDGTILNGVEDNPEGGK